MSKANTSVKHFYIPDEQSFYLLSHQDAKKLKDWLALCRRQLELLGYREIELVGKGAFGFVFAGIAPDGQQLVFKFSRINLSQPVQDRLEEEAFMLSHVEHQSVPQLIEFQRVGKQAILVMERAAGIDLEQLSLRRGPLPAKLIMSIAVQLAEILLNLRTFQQHHQAKPIVHGDIKPSNIMFDVSTQQVALIDWGSSVFAQVDEQGQFVGNNIMDLMSSDIQQTNARLGDVYFIGEEQLAGAMSTPRFDEQGLASTLYALASGQSCRFGRYVITANSLNLPKEFAQCLTAMMDDDPKIRRQAGDYFFKNIQYMQHIAFAGNDDIAYQAMIPCWVSGKKQDIESVVYSSRKSFLRAEAYQHEMNYINDAQFERYYKNYMQGMGETEKAFISAVSRLGKYPVVGGLAVRWQAEGVYIDSSLNLHDPDLKIAFELAVNNVVVLARAIHRQGVFKSCMFNAKDTLHIDREDENSVFIPERDTKIPFSVSEISLPENVGRLHSYFEDGDDPDELLVLPAAMRDIIEELNGIHHTGCIIFEAMPTHLKIHNYFVLLEHDEQSHFADLLNQLIELIPQIQGLGLSGFMKLPYKDTRYFEHIEHCADKFYPRNPHINE